MVPFRVDLRPKAIKNRRLHTIIRKNPTSHRNSLEKVSHTGKKSLEKMSRANESSLKKVYAD